MVYDGQTASGIGAILDELNVALTAFQTTHDEDDRAAMELIEMVGVDIQDITNTLDADPSNPQFSAAGELAETARWLAAYRNEQALLVTTLTALIDTATAKISHLEAR